MKMITRHSRAEREALERQDARHVCLPLPASPGFDVVLAHARHTARLLKDRQATSPSSRAVSHINALFEDSIPEAIKKTPVCRQGCAHCCYQPVIVYAPELFFLAAHIGRREGMAEKLLTSAPDQRPAMGLPCPLLENEACSVYAARPLGCHAFASLDVNDCLSTFRYLKDFSVRSPPAYNGLRNLCRMILKAAAQAAGLSTHAYELNRSALVTILAQDNAEKRWLRGEDVLAELAIVPSATPPEIAANIDQIAARVAPAL